MGQYRTIIIELNAIEAIEVIRVIEATEAIEAKQDTNKQIFCIKQLGESSLALGSSNDLIALENQGFEVKEVMKVKDALAVEVTYL